MDSWKQPITDFKKQKQREAAKPQEDLTLQTLESTQEGLQDGKTTLQQPTIIPAQLLPENKRPQHHKPNIIIPICYRRNARGHLMEDNTYKGRRCLHLVNFKYSNDNNMLDTINIEYTIYEPVK